MNLNVLFFVSVLFAGLITNSDAVWAVKKGKLVDNCMTNPKFNACIFKKSPVAQVGASIPGGAISGAHLDPLLRYGVQIKPDSKGYLRNTFIDVMPDSTRQRVKATDGNFKFNFANDNSDDHKVGQVMAYYWLNFQKKFMLSQAGGFYVVPPPNRPVPVITTTSESFFNAYWNGAEIVLGLAQAGQYPGEAEFAFSAEVLLHEMGHANLNYAIGNAVGSERTMATHSGGCENSDGCIGAINEGQADYHATMMFFDKPAIGESVMNNLDGLVDNYGIARDPTKNRDLSFTEAYLKSGGEVHAMGAVFAAVWYEVRKKAKEDYGIEGAQDVDKLFTAFLVTLQPTDTFRTAKKRIITVSNQCKGGRYTSLFQTQYAHRGIW